MTNAWEMMLRYQQMKAEEEALTSEFDELSAKNDPNRWKVYSCLSCSPVRIDGSGVLLETERLHRGGTGGDQGGVGNAPAQIYDGRLKRGEGSPQQLRPIGFVPVI